LPINQAVDPQKLSEMTTSQTKKLRARPKRI